MSNTEPPFTDDELNWYRKYCDLYEVEFAKEMVPDATDPTKSTTRLKPGAVRLLHAENLRRWLATVDALRAGRDELRKQVLKTEEQCTLAVVDRDKARSERDFLRLASPNSEKLAEAVEEIESKRLRVERMLLDDGSFEWRVGTSGKKWQPVGRGTTLSGALAAYKSVLAGETAKEAGK